MKKTKLIVGTMAAVLLASSAWMAGIGVKGVRADSDGPDKAVAPNAGVAIDEKKFPDKVFREYVSAAFDKNGDKVLDAEEIQSATYVDITNKGISSLAGIEYLTEVDRIDCGANKLKELDLSKNTKLTSLWCYENNLTKLNIRSCKKLSSLNISYNELPEIDVSVFSELTSLYCYHNKIKTLDLSKNTNLDTLSCDENEITTLDVSKNTSLGFISASRNKITSLDVSMLMYLYSLDCTENKIQKLNVSKNTGLQTLFCDDCELKELDISKNTALDLLSCNGNPITKLDVTNLKELRYLGCGWTNITSLDLTKCQKLESLLFVASGASAIDLSHNPKLHILSLSDQKLKKLDLKNNVELETLAVSYNELTELDLSANTKLQDVYVDNNLLSEIILPKTNTLQLFEGEKNLIRSLDISVCPTLVDRIKKNGIKVDEKIGSFYSTYIDEENSESLFFQIDTDVDLIGYTLPKIDPSFKDFVERLYKVALERPSDLDGKAFWVEKVGSGEYSGADCARFFLLEAPEFMNRNLSVDEFVETLYKIFFNRASDAAGKKGWVDAINSKKMTRQIVVENFIESTEWCNVCAVYGVRSGAQWHKADKASPNAIKFATRLYTCCLGRAPEQGGLNYWSLALTNREQTGCSAANEFFKSAEFIGFKLKDDEYIKRLYTTFMDREPNASEVSYWTGEIAKGTQTRDSVLAFFGQSEEFTNICQKYGIERGTI